MVIFSQVVVMSAADPAWMNCLSCQIRVLALTDILVGIHGAGVYVRACVGCIYLKEIF